MEYKIVITQKDVDEYNRRWFVAHPRAKNKPIKGPQHPSLNEYMIANNHAANKLKQNWKDFILFILKRQNLIGVGVKRCEVLYRTYFKRNVVHDLDNITPKYIFDGLTEGGFWVADDCNHVIRLTTECGYDQDNPRIELIVREL